MIEMVQAAVLIPAGYPGADPLMRQRLAQQGPGIGLTRAEFDEPARVIVPS